MFVATLFTIGKTQKQSKCPVTAEWVKKSSTCIQWNIIIFSHKKKGNRYGETQNLSQSEVTQKEKDEYYILINICGIQKNGTDDSIYRVEIKTQTQEMDMWIQWYV